MVTEMEASAGSGSWATKASQRPSPAPSARRLAALSASSSSSVASLTATGLAVGRHLDGVQDRLRVDPLVKGDQEQRAPAAAGSPEGYESVILGGGVLKVQRTASASTPPVADSVPAGTVTTYSVAMGRRSMAVRVVLKAQRLGAQPLPGAGQRRLQLHRHLLGRQRARGVASGTMGWLKVTLTKGARGISPSGAKRSTSRGPASTCLRA